MNSTDPNNDKDWLSKEKEREKKTNLFSRKKKSQRAVTADPFFVFDLILFALMLPFTMAIPGHSLMPVYLLFCFICIGVILFEVLLNRFPPTWYFIAALLVTIIAEIIAIRSMMLNR